MARERSSSSGQSLTSALSEAQSIIEAAEQRAAEIRAEAEKTFQQARDNGYREGYEKGLENAAQRALRLISDSAQVGDKLAQEAAKLALAISATVIGEQLKVDEDTVRRIAVRALQESVIGDSVTVIIHPDDRDTLNGAMQNLKRIAHGAAISIETDGSLDRGSCVVRTEFGEVDASIEALLEAVANRLGLTFHGR